MELVEPVAGESDRTGPGQGQLIGSSRRQTDREGRVGYFQWGMNIKEKGTRNKKELQEGFFFFFPSSFSCLLLFSLAFLLVLELVKP